MIGIAFIVGGVQETNVACRLESEEETVPAQVVGKDVVRGRRGSRTHKITALYKAKSNGGVRTREFTVPESFYEAAEGGLPIRVRYAASDASVAEVVGAEKDGKGNMGIGAVMSLIGAVISFFVFRR